MKPTKYRYMEFKNMLVEILKLAKPDVYVECGTQKGVTFNLAYRHCKKAIAINIVMQDSVHAGGNIERHEMDSAGFVKIFKGKIDVLFIDADHSKEGVLKDFKNLAPLVKEGTGIILFHDTYPVNEMLMKDGYCSNAWEAIDEIRTKEKDYEVFTFPGPWAGLTLMRKRGGKQLHWYTKPTPKPKTDRKKTDLFGGAQDMTHGGLVKLKRENEKKEASALKKTVPKNVEKMEVDYSLPDPDLKSDTSDER